MQNDNQITFDLKPQEQEKASIQAKVQVFEDNIIRFTVDEIQQDWKRFQVSFLIQLPEKDFINQQYLKPLKPHQSQISSSLAKFQISSSVSVEIDSSPFKLRILYNNLPQVEVNSLNLFNFEVYRAKETQKDSFYDTTRLLIDDRNYEYCWEDKFQHSGDQLKSGPISIGTDFQFFGSKILYGIPEHADSLGLKDTFDKEPYRLFNLDVFEYEVNSPMALYGHIPFIQSISKDTVSGVFWFNPSENFVDIDSHDEGKNVHWMFESGILDIFVFIQGAQQPLKVTEQFTMLTGPAMLPSYFGIGYHQCRWNYYTQDEVIEVLNGYEKHDLPLDFIWLDIEHTNEKRYLTWDSHKFPDPKGMMDQLKQTHRRLVTIIDPHIKKDSSYFVYSDATSTGIMSIFSSKNNMLVKNSNKGDFEGHCWSGNSVYPDWTREDVREWWSNYYKEKTEEEQYVWIDMNEPSVFSGIETTMPRNAIHQLNKERDIEHQELHNVFGFYYHMASYLGQIKRNENQRPFILTRSFFAGSQKFGAVWTGDNMANWEHLAISVPMILSAASAGISFIGADVGGFFQNAPNDLLIRWHQLGTFYPFYRQHSHHSNKRREPWMQGDEVLKELKTHLRIRYQILPYLYTLFRQFQSQGTPILRSMFMEFPGELFNVDDQFLFGNALLIKPVAQANQQKLTIKLPTKYTYWYDFYTYSKINVDQSQWQINYEVDISKIGVLIRPSSILVFHDRIRRSTDLMKNDPYYLLVALNEEGQAQGMFYNDDWNTFNYQKVSQLLQGEYLQTEITFINNILKNKISHSNYPNKHHNYISKITVLGLQNKPKQIISNVSQLFQGEEVGFYWNDDLKQLDIKLPSVYLHNDWEIALK